MNTLPFLDKLKHHWDQKRYLCLGLDTDPACLPQGQTQFSFNKAIIDATSDLVAAYKPNSAFYEALGSQGLETLKMTIAYIREKKPGTLVILDAKRADIGNTNKAYAQFAFEFLQADAITLNPYLGLEALNPFLSYQNKGCFILCRTSNPGAKEFQDLKVGEEPLFVKIAKAVNSQWKETRNCGLVVGATYPEELRKIRKIAPEPPFLVPGIGAQGGDLQKVLEFGFDSEGKGLLITVSRSVIFASSGPNFAQAAREVLQAFQLDTRGM